MHLERRKIWRTYRVFGVPFREEIRIRNTNVENDFADMPRIGIRKNTDNLLTGK